MNKLRIKTITCHDVYNYGASLQAFALMKYLQNYGHDVEIIDYKPEYLTFSYLSIGNKWNKNLLFRLLYYGYVIPKKILLKNRRKKFDKFTKKRLKLTDRTYYNNKDLVTDTPVAEVYIAGSDQIWNTELPNGKDPAFFLEFVPEGAVKASYAASFSVSELSAEQKELVKNRLGSFDHISVREKTGLTILKELGYDSGQVVLDPVFLIGESEWNSLVKDTSDEKYIFVYDQENNPLIKQVAQTLSRIHKLKILAIESIYPLSYADKRIKDAGPEEFLGLIKNCEICLTNSFHCTVFSIIYSRKFYLFKRRHQKVNSRMIDLLYDFGLTDRIGDENIKNINMSDIQFDFVKEKIEERIRESTVYLEKVLNSAQSE